MGVFLVGVYAYFYFTAPNSETQETPSNLPAAKPGSIKITDNGKVSKDIIEPGTGIKPKMGQKVRVHYTGYLTNGNKFDSSLDRDEPFEFIIGENVIQGWSLGLITMKVGEKSRFVIHHDYAYGERGYPPVIPKAATLIFEIELIEIIQA